MGVVCYRYVRRALLFAVVFTSIFDPTGKLFRVKYPLFSAAVIVSIPVFLSVRRVALKRKALIIYVVIFSFIIPVYGLLIGFLSNDVWTFTSWMGYFIAYLYLLFAVCVAGDIDYTKRIFLFTLNTLTLVIIATFLFAPVIGVGQVYNFGAEYGQLVYNSRTYGGTSFNVVYFVTSPLLVIAAAYWSIATATRVSLGSTLMLLLTSIALFISGTRANMAFSIVIPIVVFLFNRRIRWSIVLVCTIVAVEVYFNYDKILDSMLSITNRSNAIKLGYLADYERVFNTFHNLIFGQGLGAFFFATPLTKYVNITELTYLEIFRMYGAFVGIVILIMLFLPLLRLRRKRRMDSEYLYFGYLFYLVACIVNPFLWSSNGMLVLSIVLADFYRTRQSHEVKVIDPRLWPAMRGRPAAAI